MKKIGLFLIVFTLPLLGFSSPIYDYRLIGSIHHYDGLKEEAKIYLRVEQDPIYSDYGWVINASLKYQKKNWQWSNPRSFLGSVDYENANEGTGIPTHFMALSALSFSDEIEQLNFKFGIWHFYDIPFSYNIIGRLEESTNPWGWAEKNDIEIARTNWKIIRVSEPATIVLLGSGLIILMRRQSLKVNMRSQQETLPRGRVS